MNKIVLRQYLLAGVGSLALAAGLADAAKAAPPAPMPMPNPVYNWSGFYIGGHGGYGWARDPLTDHIFAGKTVIAPNSNGPLGGFQAGANWQSGSWVGGVEIDLSATDIKGTGVPATVPGSPTVTENLSDKFDWLGSARARLGFLPVPNLMIYGTAGPAFTRLVQTDAMTFAINAGALGSATEIDLFTTPYWRFGTVVGAGAETRLWDSNWLARVEYLHYDFGKSDTAADSDGRFLASGRMTADIVRAGLSYQLGQAAGMGSYASAVMPLKAAPAAPWSWSGFYIGAHAGYGWGHDPFTDIGEGINQNINITDINSNGFVGGFQAGYNRQMGSWLAGIELDLSGSGIKGSSSVTVPLTGGATGTDTVTESDNFELLASARARLGYLVMPDVLLYGTGGLAFTRLTGTFEHDTIVTAGGTSFLESRTDTDFRFGWVAGIGAETRLWNTNWLARLEYLHYDFGDSEDTFDDTGNTFTTGHVTADVVRAGLSYKFDWSGATGVPVRVAMPVKAMPVKAPVAAWSWSGIYLGGHVGYGWGRDPKGETLFATGNLPSPNSDPLVLTDVNSSGGVAGFQAGANWQLGAFVTGLEIDLSGTGIKGSTTNFDADGDAARLNTDRFDMLGSARARLGYLALPNVLVYGTGGLAWTQLEQSSLDVFAGPPANNTLLWKFGWVAGIGGETRIADTNWLLRLEYLHYDFGNSPGTNFSDIDNNFNIGGTVLNGSSGQNTFTGHLTTDVVRTALSFKFN